MSGRLAGASACPWRSASALGLKRKGSTVLRLQTDGRRRDGRGAHLGGRRVQASALDKLDNIVAIVDVNNCRPTTHRSVLGFEPLADKWRAFGWLCSASTATTSRRWSRLRPCAHAAAQGAAQ